MSVVWAQNQRNIKYLANRELGMVKQRAVGSLTLGLAIFYLISTAILIPEFTDSTTRQFIDLKSLSFVSFNFYYTLIFDGFICLIAGIGLLHGDRIGYQLGIFAWAVTFIFTIKKLILLFSTIELVNKIGEAQVFGFFSTSLQATKIVISVLIVRHLSKELFKKEKILSN
jgi:hypothetical protein